MVSTPTPSANPLGDATASEDQVGLAVRSFATAVAFEVGALSLVAWGATSISRAAGITRKEDLTPDSAQVNMMIFGLVISIFLSAVISWTLLAPVRSNFRRGGISIVAAVAGLLIAGIVTWLVAGIVGFNALLALVVVMAVLTRVLWRSARRAALALPSSQSR